MTGADWVRFQIALAPEFVLPPCTKDAPVSYRSNLGYSIKLVDLDAGMFDGYAASWDVDRVGDRIIPGAFAESIRKHAGAVPLLWQHEPRSPLGVARNLKEDFYGLKFCGEVSRKTQRCEEALDLIRLGGLKSFSIGYYVRKDRQAAAVRELLELDLVEISLVSTPANGNAGLAA